MMAVANDLMPAGAPRRDWEMTVFELAIFMCVFRASRPPRVEEICKVLGGWFECSVDPPATSTGIENMLANNWVTEEGGAFRATEEGRSAVRPMMNGVIRLLDQGTRMIDVALLMTVLRLTTGELDNGVRDR